MERPDLVKDPRYAREADRVQNRDTLVPLAATRALAEALPHATHATIAGAGHMLPWEAPGEFADSVARGRDYYTPHRALLPKNKALPIVVVCGRGAQSSRAVVMLKKLGYENARTLTGGLMAWRNKLNVSGEPVKILSGY